MLGGTRRKGRKPRILRAIEFALGVAGVVLLGIYAAVALDSFAQSRVAIQEFSAQVSASPSTEEVRPSANFTYISHAGPAVRDVANLFEKAAHTERFQHFAEEAQLAGLVGSDQDNLRDAIKGESYEVETMYLGFAKDATAAGDKAAAARFQEIRNDEMGHRDAFKAALAKLQDSQTQGQQ